MSKQDNQSAKEELMKGIKNVMSQYHKEVMADTVKRGMHHRATNGYAVTRPPYGYSKTETPGFFNINRHGKALREILLDFANDKTDPESFIVNLALLFWDFNAKYQPCVIVKVKQLLSNPYYLGYIRHDGELYNGLHDPLFTAEEHKGLWQAICYAEIYHNSLKSIDKNLQNH